MREKASGRFIVSLLFECEVEEKARTGQNVGCDLGLKTLIITSDDDKFPVYRFDKVLERKLNYWKRKSARQLLRAKEAMKEDHDLYLCNFKNYNKARRMAAKYEEKAANQRYDYLQKLSTKIVEEYDIIVLEDLDIKKMMKNHKLARAIGNAGWGMFITMLQYKCEWYGKTFVQVDPSFTSQTCSVCGHRNNRMGMSKFEWLNVREWTCPCCGTHHDRDENAAKNILHEGLKKLGMAA